MCPALWKIFLMCSSYNSCVFEVTASQDFQVSFISSSDLTTSEAAQWSRQENPAWMARYSNTWVPGYGDLALIVDQVAFGVEVNQNWTYTLQSLNTSYASLTMCSWPLVGLNYSTWPVALRREGPHMIPEQSQQIKVFTDMDNFTSHPAEFPKVQLPMPQTISTQGNKTTMNTWTFCPDSGWQLPGSGFHIKHAQSKPVSSGSRVQVAVWFLVIVILCNISKVVGISMAIRTCSTAHIVTVGDAVASFLETPEELTEGKCMAKTPKDVLASIAEALAIKKQEHDVYSRRQKTVVYRNIVSQASYQYLRKDMS